MSSSIPASLLLVAALAGGCATDPATLGRPRPVSSSSSGASSTSATTSSSASGAAVAECGCVTALAGQACASCYNLASARAGACATEGYACQASAGCTAAFACLNQRDFAAEELDGCLELAAPGDGGPQLHALLACTCGSCADECAVEPAVDCALDRRGAGGAAP